MVLPLPPGELNILDGATVTTTELNLLDGGTSATSTTLAAADRVVLNDAGTMKQVALSDLVTFLANGTASSFVVDGNAPIDRSDQWRTRLSTSAEADQTPSASDLVAGELAIRTDTGVVFTKKDDGTVAEIAGGGAEAINDLSDAVTNTSGRTIGLGTDALANDDGTTNLNTALGYQALTANTSGAVNTAVGDRAGQASTTSSSNTFIGATAGYNNTTGTG